MKALRPNVLIIAGALTIVCIVGIWKGETEIGAAAVGALCVIAKDIIDVDKS